MTLNKLNNKRNQSQTIIPNILGKPMFEHIISKNTVVSHKSRKYISNLKWDRENPSFSWCLKKTWCKNGSFFKRDTGCLRQWTVTETWGKNKKFFKKLSWKRKTRIFRDWIKSPGQAAKTLKDKIVKNFLIVFCD